MMERDDHFFDKTLREKLANYSEPVPDDVWENVSKKRMLFNNFSSRFKLIGGVSILLLVAVTVAISMALKSRDNNEQNLKTAAKAPETQVINNIFTHDVIKNNSQSISKTVISNSKNQNKQHVTDDIQKPQPLLSEHKNKSSENIIIQAAVKPNSQNNQPQSINNYSTENNLNHNSSTATLSNNNQSITIILTNDSKNTSSAQIANLTMRETADIFPSDNQTTNNIEVITAPTQQPGNIQTPASDTASSLPNANSTNPDETTKFHFRCLDIMISPGLVFKSTEASDPSSEAYAGMLDELTASTYTFGLEIRYRYYLNDFWNLATGLKYYQVKEEMTGQISPEQVSVKQTTGMIITPFNPPRQVTFTDTITTAAKTISQYNTFSYLRIPVLIGSNFIIFKTPVNLYGGFGYCFSIRQNGAYIDPVTHNTSDFQNSMNNPYKNAQAVNVQLGVNANRKLSKRTDLLFGIDYSRYVIPITDNAYQYQQYYQILNLNIGITYQLF